ncbi:MAG TPA: vitamin K epoxide reductase family protein [Crinalium sp.]
MSRRRQTPWIHRNSRYLIGAIAILGAINTGYITITKLLGGETACPTSGCEQVLSSDYAYVFGIPLSVFGLLAYIAMAALAFIPLAVNPEEKKELHTSLNNWSWLAMFAGSTAMLVFSGYLMYIMATKFVAVYGPASVCIYCIGSAILATTLFVLTLIGRAWEDVGQLVLTFFLVSMVVLIGALGVYADDEVASDANSNTPGQAGPVITTTSGSAEIALAKHLKEVGAKMYGAFWCPHCHDQKQFFGRQAFQEITYVECDPNGKNAQPSTCQAANVTGYPTWEINGKLYPGTQTLEQLADESGYQGPRNFQTRLGG